MHSITTLIGAAGLISLLSLLPIDIAKIDIVKTMEMAMNNIIGRFHFLVVSRMVCLMLMN